MEEKIVYRFETPVYPGNILYVNLIENYNCINDCLFCSRPRTRADIGKPNIYEKKAGSFLYLDRSPTIEQIMTSIDSEIRDDDKEVAIIGLGEPLIYLPKVAEVIRRVKERYDIKTRVDTNGLVKCMYKNPTELLEQAGLDEIRISINAVNEQEYNQLCRPKVKNAFPNLLSFIKECVASKIRTYVSFVTGFNQKYFIHSQEELTDFAVSLGVQKQNILFREYVLPIS